MTLPIDRGDREFQKFVETTGGKVAVRTLLDEISAGVVMPTASVIPAGSFHTAIELPTVIGVATTILALPAVPALIVRRILSIRVSCRFESSWQALNGATLVASGRTGPGYPADDYSPKPCLSLPAGSTLSIKVSQSNGPISTAFASVGGYDETA